MRESMLHMLHMLHMSYMPYMLHMLHMYYVYHMYHMHHMYVRGCESRRVREGARRVPCSDRLPRSSWKQSSHTVRRTLAASSCNRVTG